MSNLEITRPTESTTRAGNIIVSDYGTELVIKTGPGKSIEIRSEDELDALIEMLNFHRTK